MIAFSLSLSLSPSILVICRCLFLQSLFSFCNWNKRFSCKLTAPDPILYICNDLLSAFAASHYNDGYQNQMCEHDGNSGECTNECSNECGNNCSNDCTNECTDECSNNHHWTSEQQSSSQHNIQYENYGGQQQQYYHSQEASQTPKIISNKSSKEIYKDLAKEWGITCKMSDGCRCMECQSHYFDCDYDEVSQSTETRIFQGFFFKSL